MQKKLDVLGVVPPARKDPQGLSVFEKKILLLDSRRWLKALAETGRELKIDCRPALVDNVEETRSDTEVTTDLLIDMHFRLDPREVCRRVSQYACDARFGVLLILSYEEPTLKQEWHQQLGGCLIESENMRGSDLHYRFQTQSVRLTQESFAMG